MEKKYCFECNEKVDGVIKNISDTFNIRGQEIEATVEVLECPNCHARLLDENMEKKADEIIYGSYQKANHLLSTQEIKDIRARIGISQTTFSKILGFGEKTFARYESGSLQDKAHDLVIRLADDIYSLSLMIKEMNWALSEREKKSVQERFNFLQGKKQKVT